MAISHRIDLSTPALSSRPDQHDANANATQTAADDDSYHFANLHVESTKNPRIVKANFKNKEDALKASNLIRYRLSKVKSTPIELANLFNNKKIRVYINSQKNAVVIQLAENTPIPCGQKTLEAAINNWLSNAARQFKSKGKKFEKCVGNFILIDCTTPEDALTFKAFIKAKLQHRHAEHYGFTSSKKISFKIQGSKLYLSVEGFDAPTLLDIVNNQLLNADKEEPRQKRLRGDTTTTTTTTTQPALNSENTRLQDGSTIDFNSLDLHNILQQAPTLPMLDFEEPQNWASFPLPTMNHEDDCPTGDDRLAPPLNNNDIRLSPTDDPRRIKVVLRNRHELNKAKFYLRYHLAKSPHTSQEIRDLYHQNKIIISQDIANLTLHVFLAADAAIPCGETSFASAINQGALSNRLTHFHRVYFESSGTNVIFRSANPETLQNLIIYLTTRLEELGGEIYQLFLSGKFQIKNDGSLLTITCSEALPSGEALLDFVNNSLIERSNLNETALPLPQDDLNMPLTTPEIQNAYETFFSDAPPQTLFFNWTPVGSNDWTNDIETDINDIFKP